jgi:hypothetical protein
MINIISNEADSSALRSWPFQHPVPWGQVRMETLYLRSPGVAKTAIRRRGGMSKASIHRDLKAYMVGGVAPLKRLDHSRPRHALTNHRTTLEAYLHPQPPATVAPAAAKIAELTGMMRKPTQVQQYWRTREMTPMKIGMLPAIADVAAQDAFTKKPGAKVTGRWGWSARRLFY